MALKDSSMTRLRWPRRQFLAATLFAPLGTACSGRRGARPDPAGVLTVSTDETGRSVVDVRVVEEEDAAGVLSALVTRGVPVARFEQASLGLADLIQRAIQATGGGSHA